MATAAIDARQADEAKRQHQQGAGGGAGGEGLRQYYQQRIQDMQLLVRQKFHDLQRLEAQRNDLNARGFIYFTNLFHWYVNFSLLPLWKTLGFGRSFVFIFLYRARNCEIIPQWIDFTFSPICVLSIFALSI